MPSPHRILIIEDSPSFRQALEITFQKEPDFGLSGAHSTAEVALRKLQGEKTISQPHVILLDLNLPGMSGLDAMNWIREYSPESKIIVLTQSEKEEDVLRAISQGAAGYLLKESSLEEIIDGIRTVLAGGTLLDSTIARFLSGALQQFSSSPHRGTVSETTGDLLKTLSSREMEILSLLGEGLLKKEIADRLGIGFSTVATHIRNIYGKLQVENAPAAISKAYQKGLLK